MVEVASTSSSEPVDDMDVDAGLSRDRSGCEVRMMFPLL